MIESLWGAAITDHGQSGETHDEGTEMVLHVWMSAAFVFILRDLSVSVVKNYAKQSQFAQACRPGANDPIVRNKANFSGGCAAGAGGHRAKQSQLSEGERITNYWPGKELREKMPIVAARKAKPIISSVERNALRRHYEQVDQGHRLPAKWLRQTKPIRPASRASGGHSPPYRREGLCETKPIWM